MIIIIAAVSENNSLGKNNSLLWHLPDDLKRFRLLTSEHYVIMGRKTFESLSKPLPNRTNIIITRQKNYQAKGCIIVNGIKKAINSVPKNGTIFIIGGGEIYNLGLKEADKIELTVVHTKLKGDTFFPVLNINEWKLTNEEFHPKDEKHIFSFTHKTFLRNRFC